MISQAHFFLINLKKNERSEKMSEAIRKTEQANTEGYSPKKPELASMMKEAQTKNEEENAMSATESGLTGFEVVKCGPYRFVGEAVYKGNKRGGEGTFDFMWSHSDWVFQELDGMKEYASDIVHNAALITWDKYDDKSELFGYYVGRFMKAETPITKEVDFDYFDIPEGYIAKVWHKGNINERHGIFWYKDWLVDDAIKQTGTYSGGSGSLWSAEICLNPDENGDALIGAYSPCVSLAELREQERKAAEEREKARLAWKVKMASSGIVSYGGLWNPDRSASTLDGYSQVTKTDWASLGEFELFNCLAQNIIVELDDVYSVTGFTFADSHSQICNPDYLSGEEVVLYSIYVTSDINDWGNAVKNVNCAAQKNRAGETVNFGAKAGKYVILDFTASPGNAAFIAVADPFSVNVMP